MQLKGAHTLITGANRGIGLAIAKACAHQGSHIHLGVRSIDTSLEKDILKAGAASVTSWQIDISERKSIEDFLKRFQVPVDILVNNAGLLTGGLLEEQPIDDIYRMFQVNLVGLIHISSALLLGMLERGRGKIVNNASVSGIMHLPCASTYTAAKSGVVAFNESLRQELVGTGVSTLLLLTPGVKTRMFDKIPELYGANVDMSLISSSISAEEWSAQVIEAIKDDRDTLSPSGQTAFALKLAQHMPKMFAKLVSSKFSREKR